jgi:hypothetical protein
LQRPRSARIRGTLREVKGRKGYCELRADLGADPFTKRRWQKPRLPRHWKEAEKALRQLCIEVDAGRHRSSEETFGSLLEAWYEAARIIGQRLHRASRPAGEPA